MGHPVMWFEVLGNDGDKLRQFYGDLFQWTFDTNNPTKYGIVDTRAGRGIPGGIGQTFPGTRSWSIFYVETPDIDASLARAQKLGGRVVTPKVVNPDATYAVFEDPEGHTVGLVEAKAGAQ